VSDACICLGLLALLIGKVSRVLHG
jgi:hypothetical protein